MNQNIYNVTYRNPYQTDGDSDLVLGPYREVMVLIAGSLMDSLLLAEGILKKMYPKHDPFDLIQSLSKHDSTPLSWADISKVEPVTEPGSLKETPDDVA